MNKEQARSLVDIYSGLLQEIAYDPLTIFDKIDEEEPESRLISSELQLAVGELIVLTCSYRESLDLAQVIYNYPYTFDPESVRMIDENLHRKVTELEKANYNDPACADSTTAFAADNEALTMEMRGFREPFLGREFDKYSCKVSEKHYQATGIDNGTLERVTNDIGNLFLIYLAAYQEYLPHISDFLNQWEQTVTARIFETQEKGRAKTVKPRAETYRMPAFH